MNIEEFEQACTHCDGDGTQRKYFEERNGFNCGSNRRCYYCTGRGKQLTPAGEEFIKFLKHYLRLDEFDIADMNARISYLADNDY